MITRTGRVGIGTTGPNYALDVTGDVSATGCYYAAGSVIGGACLSDERVKKETRPFSPGFAETLALRLVQYKYNSLGGTVDDGNERIGVIAPDLEHSAPEVVSRVKVRMRPSDGQETEVKAVNYGAFTYMLINSVKELYAKITELSAADGEQGRRLAALELENRTLRQENNQLKERLTLVEKAVGVRAAGP